MSRKPRSDSKLDALSEEQQAQLAEWLAVENLSYAAAKEKVREEFGVSTSVAALQSFYSRFAAPWKYARSKEAADSFAELMAGNYDEATIKAAKQLAFDSLSSPTPDLKAAKTLLKIVGDSAKLKISQDKLTLDGRKVALLEKKAAQADAAEGVTRDETLTPEARERKLKEIFGLK